MIMRPPARVARCPERAEGETPAPVQLTINCPSIDHQLGDTSSRVMVQQGLYHVVMETCLVPDQQVPRAVR